MGTDIVKKKKTKKAAKKTIINGEEVEIWLLIDAIYYFLTRVFIVPEANRYRLYIISERGIEFCDDYGTIKGAKIAFLKFYGLQLIEAAREKKRGKNWRHIPVDRQWLEKQIEGKKILNRFRRQDPDFSECCG